jgi:transcriptional regulator with XRE-family HTH domain
MVTRIRKLLEHKQLTPTQFADLIGVGRPVMSHILSERNKPSLEVVQRIISAFPELSLPWLLNGNGEMLASAATEAPAATPAPVLPAEPSPVASTTAPVAQEPVVVPASPATEEPVASAPEPIQEVSAPSTSLAALPEAPIEAPAPEPAALRPFRAARFVPSASRVQAAPVAPAAPQVTQTASIAPLTPELPKPAAAEYKPVQASPALPTEPAPGALTVTAPEAALLPFMAEPGKAIRRIVIFYRDGSFADYQPEQ